MHLTSSALAPATVVNYVTDLRAFLRWSERTSGDATATRVETPFGLDASDVQVYRVYLQETKNHLPATINRRLQAMRKFYDFAIEQGWTPVNPASEVQLLSEVVSQRTRCLTADDVSRLLTAVQDGHPRRVARDWAIIEVLLGAGLKLGELTQLRLEDVHLEPDSGGPSLDVRSVAAEPGMRTRPARTIPLEAGVSEALGAFLPARRASPGVDRLFVNRDGNPLSTRSVQRLLRRYAHAAGLENLTTQSLRYAYASKVYESSGDLKTVARLLGHRHLATTIRYLRPNFGQPPLPGRRQRSPQVTQDDIHSDPARDNRDPGRLEGS